MEQNNKSSKRNFIPQSIGDSIKKINRSFVSKFAKIEFIIHSKWHDIVGEYFVEYSEPKNIVKVPNYENDMGEKVYKIYLNVSVAPPAAVEFQHFKDKILEKINSYFGYKAIIDLRIQQNYLPKVKKNKLKMNDKYISEKDKINISNEVKELSYDKLKKSLIDLGRNITKESK